MGATDHCHPKDAPTDNAKQGDQVYQPFRRSQLGFLGFATRLQYFVKDRPGRNTLRTVYYLSI
jgi:hypothetical protein